MDRLTRRYATHVAVVCKNCNKSTSLCTQRGCNEVLRNRLAAYEDTGLEPEEILELKSFTQGGVHKADEGWLHVQELLQAEKDGRLRILHKGEDGTCGGCGHFKRIPGKRCGTCDVRSYYVDRRGHIEAHRGTFTPSQSRKCCKQYIPREEAEAAMAGGGG